MRRSWRFAAVLTVWFGACLCRAQTPGIDVAEIVFDKTPQQRGIGYDPAGVKYTRLTLVGKEYDAWMAERPHDPKRGWERTWRLKVKDPKFQLGKRPVVDLEITYHLPAWSGVDVYAAVAEGKVRKIGGGWGNTKDWKTIHLQLNDAFFGDAEKSEGLGTFDLRITGANAPLYLRSVRLTFYDPETNVHWDRMLKANDLAGDTPGGVMAFTRKSSAITANLQNLAFVDRPIRYHLALQDFTGKSLVDTTDGLKLAAKSSNPLRLPFDPTTWPLGPYKGQLQFMIGDAPVLTLPLRLGVISDTVLDKARDDEFFYGLDPANSTVYPTDTPAAAAYFRLMGVDFLRNLPLLGSIAEPKLQKAIEFLQHEQLRAAVMIDPPKPSKKDAPIDAKELAKTGDTLAMVIRHGGGRSIGHVFMAELGNEPDLPYFWPADVKSYVEAMNALCMRAQAARTEARLKPGDFLLANGGLSFAGVEGDRRSRQLLQLFDPSKLDLIAYHGHGPGIAAERTAFERLRDARAQTPVKSLPAIETESGYSGGGDVGLLEQARTVVEKMTYAQSVGLPSFAFFRLFMEGEGHEGDYGMTDRFVQPRPSVLSHRNLVERLRHQRFVTCLKPEAGSGVNVFLFHEISTGGQPTGRKTIVAFAEKPSQNQLSIRLDDRNAVQSSAIYDLFGNDRPVTSLGSNIALLPVTNEPAYLTWTSPGPAEAVKIVPQLLTLQVSEPILQGTDTAAKLLVRNASGQPITAQLKITAGSPTSLTVQPAEKELTLAANGEEVIPVTIHAGPEDAPPDLPRWWRMFPDADPAQLQGQSMKKLPERMKKADGTDVVGRQMFAVDNRLEFTKPFGNPKEHRPVIGMAYIDAPRDMTLPACASADWWMDWYVNGERVYSTQATGNRGMAAQLFDLPLKAGRNVVAFHCASGSQGWSIDFGGPRDRQRLTTNALPLEHVRVDLSSKGQVLAELVSPLERIPLLPALGDVATDQDWQFLEPFAVLGPELVRNRFDKEPDSKRWYHGADDFSAVVWLRDDSNGNRLSMFVAVRDDRHIAEGDSLTCSLTTESGQPISEVTATTAKSSSMPDSSCKATASREDAAPGGPLTIYRLEFPGRPRRPFRIRLQLTDDDGFGLKQTLETVPARAATD